MLRRISIALAALAALAACVPVGGFDSGNAQVQVQRAGESLDLTHDPTLSQVTLTPPVEGVVELTFAYQDPLVTVTLRLDASQLSEGEAVSLPVAEDTLFLAVAFDDAEFVSSADGASGTVALEVLNVDDASGSAEVYASFDVTLAASDPASDETVQAQGFLEGSVGQSGLTDDTAGDDAPVNVDVGG